MSITLIRFDNLGGVHVVIIALWWFAEAENDLRDLNKQSKDLSAQLDKVKGDEQEIQDKINEDSKDLDKISTKISSLLKKVSVN